jgi:hypothetical protein
MILNFKISKNHYVNTHMVKTSQTYKTLILLIFILSTSLRLGLVRYNRWSNDDHAPVIRIILKTGNLPEKPDCWECYQPKFFHYSAAKILKLPWLGPALRKLGIAKAVGWINFFAGLLTLCVIAVFITNLPVKSEVYKLLSFGLIALNPKLIGINSQATNDTFAILFSTLALFCTFLFLQKQQLSTFLLTILFVLLGISSKTNTWITFMAITLVLFIKAWTQRKNSYIPVMTGMVFIISILFISIHNPLNQYITNYLQYGSPILTNVEKQPFPYFFQKTVAARPGILSIYDGLFTFKFFDLIRHPIIDNSEYVYSDNRTSLWTQLYGRAHSIHFDNWPKIWSAKGTENFTRTRVIYILALLPTFLLLFGVIRESYLLLKSIFKQDIAQLSNKYFGLATIAFIGYIFLIVIYSLQTRRFSSMKVIFIYPALICYPIFFISAVEFFKVRLMNRFPWICLIFTIWIVALLVLYSLDVLAMIQLIYSRV